MVHSGAQRYVVQLLTAAPGQELILTGQLTDDDVDDILREMALQQVKNERKGGTGLSSVGITDKGDNAAFEHIKHVARQDVKGADNLHEIVSEAFLQPAWTAQHQHYGLFGWWLSVEEYYSDILQYVPNDVACEDLSFMYKPDKTALGFLEEIILRHSKFVHEDKTKESSLLLRECRSELHRTVEDILAVRQKLLQGVRHRHLHPSGLNSLGTLGLRSALHYRMKCAAPMRTLL